MIITFDPMGRSLQRLARFKDLTFCASLLHLQINVSRVHMALAAITLAGFNVLGFLVTPIFSLLMEHFLHRFSVFSKELKKIYRLEV